MIITMVYTLTVKNMFWSSKIVSKETLVSGSYRQKFVKSEAGNHQHFDLKNNFSVPQNL